MRWSIKIGEVFGISVKLHIVFLLLLLFIGWSNASIGGLPAGILSVLFLLTVFFFVLLHELGHSLAAMHYGVVVRDIVLLPIGGVARMERLPKRPAQEIIIALAGPAVNFVAALLIFLLMKLTGQNVNPFSFDFSGRDLGNGLLTINLLMGGFNLIPAFPMDGGRILRGVLAIRYRYADATRYASRVGQMFAFVFCLEGLFGFIGLTADGGSNLWLVIIGVFIFLGAGTENQMVHMQEMIDEIPVERVMTRQIYLLQPHDSLNKALEHMYQGLQDNFPVADNGQLVGMLTRDKIMAAISQFGGEAAVRDFMETRFMAVRPTARLSKVYEQMLSSRIRAVPVVEGNRVLGLLTIENVGRYFSVAARVPKKS